MVVINIGLLVIPYVKNFRVRYVLFSSREFWVHMFLDYVFPQLWAVVVMDSVYTKCLILNAIMTSLITYTDI
jgi:hypothetical protein